jgi:hypothetical protein
LKSTIQGALKNIGQEGFQMFLKETKDELLEKLDVRMTDEVIELKVDPKALTGSLVETRQEQIVF